MTPRRHDARFFALLDLANEGDAAAIQELWSVYDHDFAAKGDPRNELPTRKSVRNPTQQEKE